MGTPDPPAAEAARGEPIIDVVVVDDDRDARASLVRVLSRVPNMRVVGEAADGAGALERVRTCRPHVLLLDVHMPGMGGLEAARRLRDDADATPIVFITADPDAAASGLELVGTSLLVKSVASVRETIECVRAAARPVSRPTRRARRARRPA